jgi:trimeric autotransporter adhesin
MAAPYLTEDEMKRIGDSICVMLLAVCATLVGHAQPASKSTTTVPRLVQFSGTLTDGGGKPLTGVVGVTFALYEQQEGGSAIWMETQNVQAGGNGEYTVLLGSTRNDGIPAEAFASGERWLSVRIQGEAERPRLLMTSVPYSLKAVDAETLGGLPASAFALAGTNAGTASRAPVVEPLAGSVAHPAKAGAAVTPDVTGTGTKNYIAMWKTASALEDSLLYQTAAGNVGIGTTTPTATLESLTASATGTAVLGSASSATGANFGVSGSSASATGTGVQGVATSSTGANTGVFGASASTSGAGVIGQETAASGGVYGVYGSTVSPAGISVYGIATAGTGVVGATSGPSAFGVYGDNSATSSNAIGTYGVSASPMGYGVFGTNTTTTGAAFGVYGTNASTAGTGVVGANTAASGSTYGVYGSVVSPSGIAVNGAATSGTGVAGVTTSATAYGVYGGNASTTGNAYGVYGTTASAKGIGVRGVATATSGANYGVYGTTVSPSGVGVEATSTAGGTALVATATGGGSAGVFTGNVTITGNLAVSGSVSKSGGSFRIDHPLDPEHKYLYHSFVESPDMMNIYNGVVTLSRHGDAVVKLPEWFGALNSDFRYQLTCIGGFAPVFIASEISGNQFKIGGGRPGMKVSWQVTGIRQDAYAKEHRIPVEEDK